MASRYKFYDNVFSDDFSHDMVGFPTTQLSEVFNFNDNNSYKIPIEHEYRPDLIAYKFYGDVRLFWILVWANNFPSSPEDFTLNRIIKVPRFEKAISVI